MTTYRSVSAAEDVTAKILEAAEGIYDGWYADEPRVDWDNFIDRLDGMRLEDDSTLDMGESMTSPAVKAIKAHIRKYAKS